MNLKQLKYVIVLANERSFSKAADVLNISQPSLSQYIKKIEKQIGLELFERANGHVRLTDAGRIYLDTGKKILDLEHQMQSQLLELSGCKAGSIIVGTTPFRSVTMMPRAVAEFKKLYPGIHVVVDERGNQELSEAAERGEFDVCVATLPINERIYNYDVIMEEEVFVAVPRGSELDRKLEQAAIFMKERKHRAVDVQLLNGESFVMITDVQIMQKKLRDLCMDYNLDLQVAAIVKSLEAQNAMVREGVGAALVPTGVEKFEDKDGEVRYYSFIQEIPRRTVVAMYHREKILSKVVKDFITIMQNISW